MEGENGTVADELRRRLRNLLYATCLLYGVVIVLGCLAFWTNHQQNSRTHNALCTFHDDLQKRVDNTKDYLIKHPEGFPGLTAAALTKSINDQERAIEALSSLNCN